MLKSIVTSLIGALLINNVYPTEMTQPLDDTKILMETNLYQNYGSTDSFIQENLPQQKSTFSKLAPTLVPALTGVGALIIIGVSIYDFSEEGYSHRRLCEVLSHLFWLSSATVGVSYNLKNSLRAD